jgi:hypothetical protein
MKKSELKDYIKSEIINELSMDEVTIETSPENLDKVKPKAGEGDVIKVTEENIGLADLEERGYKAGQKSAYTYASLTGQLRNRPDKLAFNKGFIQGVKDELEASLNEGYEEQGFESVDETESLDEMAKIKGDLKVAIEKVINADANKELDRLSLKKAINADKDVKAALALGNQELWDPQLSKFIAAAKGEREIGQRGRKPNPNTEEKPKPTSGKVGRPAKSKEEKEKESKTVASKLSKSVTTVKGDEPTAKDIQQAIGFVKKGKKDLQAQEKRKMVKAFVADMKKQGIVSPNGKIEDRKKYDAAWSIAKPEIEIAVKNIK